MKEKQTSDGDKYEDSQYEQNHHTPLVACKSDVFVIIVPDEDPNALCDQINVVNGIDTE